MNEFMTECIDFTFFFFVAFVMYSSYLRINDFGTFCGFAL